MGEIVLVILAISIISSFILLKLLDNSKNDIDGIIQLNIKSAKFNDNFISVEIEDTNYKDIERYDINKVKIIDNENEQDYINKYYDGYGKLVEVELFCSRIL